MNNKLVIFLDKILGNHKEYSGNELYYKCPLCKRADNAKKLAIKLDENAKDKEGKSLFGHWHCWRDNSHAGQNLYTLLKKIGASKSEYIELNSLLRDTTELKNFNNIIKNFSSNKKFINKSPLLPDEFKSLTEDSINPHYKNALNYILKRGITKNEIIKYNMGYCDSGKYAGYIILPSYDFNGNLNYFTARSYYKSELKYKNPPYNKNIIFNEIFINWKYPIVLCEGVFDAYAIRRNAIPILGKYIQSSLKLAILKNGVPKVYVALDRDAIKDSIKIIEEFIRNGISVHFVELPLKDPSELGYKKVWEHIKKSKEIHFEDLIKMKLNI